MSRGFDAWVLFDGACGFCDRWVPFWGRLLAAHGVGIARLQERWVRERLGRTEDKLLKDLLVLGCDGMVHAGADAYRFVFRRIPWAWPFDWLSRIPLGRQIFNAAYQGFARNRHRFSNICGLGDPLGGRAEGRSR